MIEDAKDAELCRNIARSREAFTPIWPDIKTEPDFSEFGPLIEAELLRLAGFLLSFYGKSRNLSDHQARAKNILTRSICIFEKEGMRDKAAEAKVILALSYWYAGEVEDCDALLDLVEHEFDGNELHPVRIQIQLNRIIGCYSKGDYGSALEILGRLAVPMEFCSDHRLVAGYHNQAGVAFTKAGRIDQAIYHMSEAVRKARSVGNDRFVGLNLNNIALAYARQGRFEKAFECVIEARAIFTALGDTGWLPHVFDTHALLLLDDGKSEEALKQVETALEYFTNGEDVAGLVESMWTKVRCLIRLGRRDEAVELFESLEQLAAKKIGGSFPDKYARALASELSDIHSNKRPEIYSPVAAKIRGARHEFESVNRSFAISSVWLASGLLSPFGIHDAACVAVSTHCGAHAGSQVLFAQEGRIAAGTLHYDELSGMYYTEADGEPVLLSDVQIIGLIAGFCPLEAARDGNIAFVPLPCPAE